MSQRSYLERRATAVLLQVTVAAGNDRKQSVRVWWKPRGRGYGFDDLLGHETFDHIEGMPERERAVRSALAMLEELLDSIIDGG